MKNWKICFLVAITVFSTAVSAELSLVREVDLGGRYVNEVAIVGTTVIAAAERYLYTVNISNPENPTVVSVRGPGVASYTGIEAAGGHVFAVSGGKVEVYALNQGTLNFVSEVPVSNFNCEVFGTHLSGNKLYISYRFCGTDVVDVSDPANLVFQENLYQGSQVWSVLGKGQNLFIGTDDVLRKMSGGQEVRSLQLQGQIRAIFALAYEQGTLTVITEGMTYKITPSLAILSSSPNFIQVFGYAVWGTKAYLADLYGWGELLRGPGAIQSFYLSGYSFNDISVQQGLAVIAAGPKLLIMQ